MNKNLIAHLLVLCVGASTAPLASSARGIDCASGEGSDLVFANGYELPPPFAYTAFASDVSSDAFIAFDLTSPDVVVPVGAAHGTAFLMDFVGDDFSRAFGIDAFGASVNTFASIDTTSGAITPIGVSNPSADAGGWTGFKVDPSSGIAYAVATTCGSSSHLYTIDLATGAATLVTEIAGLSCVYRIAISPDGTMFGLDLATDTIHSIDKTTGVATLVGPVGFDVGSSGDLDFDDSGGVLYFAGTNSGTATTELRTIDPNALVGPLDAGELSGFAIATATGNRVGARPRHTDANGCPSH